MDGRGFCLFIFNYNIIFSYFLRLVRFKRFSDYFDFIALILIRFLIIMIKIKTFILIQRNAALVKYFIQCTVYDKLVIIIIMTSKFL